jgi:heat-inducible transcriptional repressor
MTSIGEPLVERQRLVLFSAIAEYIASGAPVSSKALAARSSLGLSASSIRRTLHELTRAGMLIQPHTSAGRIPTDQAFRVFVDALRETADDVDQGLRSQLRHGIRDLLPGEAGAWRDTVKLLSDLSAHAALAITPAVSDSILRQMRFVPLEDRELLAVVVTRDGLVHNSYLESAARIDDSDLERIHNYLGELVTGRTLNEVRRLLREELEDARVRCDALRERATILGAQALESSVERDPEIVIEGRSWLLAEPDLRDRLEELMGALEEKRRILDLLDQAAANDRGPLVIIGREGGEDFKGCALITSPFGVGGAAGRIGILGPMRMDYPAMIPLVELSARLVSMQLEESGGEP